MAILEAQFRTIWFNRVINKKNKKGYNTKHAHKNADIVSASTEEIRTKVAKNRFLSQTFAIQNGKRN